MYMFAQFERLDMQTTIRQFQKKNLWDRWMNNTENRVLTYIQTNMVLDLLKYLDISSLLVLSKE